MCVCVFFMTISLPPFAVLSLFLPFSPCRPLYSHYVSLIRFKPETIAFTLRVLVGVIILYDHVNHQGAFHKNSAINVKSAIKIIKESGSTNTDGLLNALRYTTKHLNDEDTPKSIKQLLA